MMVDVAGCLLLLAALPLLVELLVLSVAALLPARRPNAVDAPTLRLAVVVPAHNEELLIGACVQSLRSSRYAATIYVVAHNCSDATAERAAAGGAEVLVLREDSGHGKGAALQHGFAQAIAAGAEGVLVIDADSVVAVNLTERTAAALQAGSAATQCRYVVANVDASPRTQLMSLALLGFNVLRPRGRSRMGLSCGIFGNGFALRAETLARLPYVAHSVVEDLEYHLMMVRDGLRVDYLDDASVMGEMPVGKAAASTQRARWEGGRMLMRRRFALPLLRGVLRRGDLRLLEPLLDLLALPLGTGALLALLALLAPDVRAEAVLSLGILALYVIVSAGLDGDPIANLKALAFAPLYVASRVTQVSRNRSAAGKDAEWVRTERNEEASSTKRRDS